MTGALSNLPRRSDIKAMYKRPGRTRAHRFDNATDADIRNLVEGYASEYELSDAAEIRFAHWYDVTFADLPVLGDDVHFREVNCAAYVSGYLSAAQDMGHLPAGYPT